MINHKINFVIYIIICKNLKKKHNLKSFQPNITLLVAKKKVFKEKTVN